MIKTTGYKPCALIVAAVSLLVAPLAFADDADDVMATVQKWVDLEHDLDAQAELIRDDRVQIFEMVR